MTLSEGSSHDMGQFEVHFLDYVDCVAVAGSFATDGQEIPDVVFLLIFGLLIGPNMLNLASWKRRPKTTCNPGLFPGSHGMANLLNTHLS